MLLNSKCGAGCSGGGSRVAAGDRVSAVSCVSVWAVDLRNGPKSSSSSWKSAWWSAHSPVRMRTAGVAQFCLLSGCRCERGQPDQVCPHDGIKRSSDPSSAFSALGDFPPGHHRRQCPHAALGRLARQIGAGTVGEHRTGRHRQGVSSPESQRTAAETGVALYDNQRMRKSIAGFTDHRLVVKGD